MVFFRLKGTTPWTQVATQARTKIHQVEVSGLDSTKDYEFVVRSAACNGAGRTDTNNGAGYDFFYPQVPTLTRFFSGVAQDQANKTAGSPTATWQAAASTSEPPIVQQVASTFQGGTHDTLHNARGAFWDGNVPQALNAGTPMTVEAYASSVSGNAFATDGMLTIFAGSPLAKVHQQAVSLSVGPTPARNRFSVTLQNPIPAGTASIQFTDQYVNNDFQVSYFAPSTPAKFSVLLGTPPSLPKTGPVPPPSAGGSGITAPDVRTGPATAGDIAAGTCFCDVPARVDLSLAKTDTPDPVLNGQSITYHLTVSNGGPDAATGVTLTDTVPAGTTFVSATPSQGTCTSAVTCSLGSLAKNATATVDIVVRATQAGTVNNSAGVTGNEPDPNGANNTATASTTVNPAADLSVTKTDSPDPVLRGGNITYHVTVGNSGPDAATGVTLTDNVPAGTTFVSATPSQGTCTSAVSCNLGTVANGGSATVDIVVKTTLSGTVTNTASVSGNLSDPVAGNNSATAATTVNEPTVDRAIAMTDSPDPVGAGGNVTYHVTVTNTGPGTTTATGVTVTDPLPAGTSFVAATPSQGTCTGGATVTCSLGALVTGSTATVDIVVKTSQAGTLTNTATVSGNEPDPNDTNNSATTTTTVTAAADLAVVKAGPTAGKVGQAMTYTIVVTNNGPSTAQGVSVTDTLPKNAGFGTVSSTQGSCAPTPHQQSVVCSIGTMASGAQVTVTLVIKPTRKGDFTDTAVVSSTSPNDPVSTNNTSSVTTFVTP